MSNENAASGPTTGDTAEEAENARIARAWFDFHTAGDADGAYDLVSEDVVWEGPLAPPNTKIHTRARVKEIIKKIMAVSVDGKFRFKIHQQVAKGDLVVTRAESHVPLRNGKIYSNKYTFWFQFKDGLIVWASEHVDTAHAADRLAGVY